MGLLTFCMVRGDPKSMPPCTLNPQGALSNLDILISTLCSAILNHLSWWFFFFKVFKNMQELILSRNLTFVIYLQYTWRNIKTNCLKTTLDIFSWILLKIFSIEEKNLISLIIWHNVKILSDDKAFLMENNLSRIFPLTSCLFML